MRTQYGDYIRTWLLYMNKPLRFEVSAVTLEWRIAAPPAPGSGDACTRELPCVIRSAFAGETRLPQRATDVHGERDRRGTRAASNQTAPTDDFEEFYTAQLEESALDRHAQARYPSPPKPTATAGY